MKEYQKISRLMERIIHKYNQVEKIKRYYGSDVLLSRAEIHTISAVGDYSNINVTTLAKLLGVTKGAESQMIYKLVDKGFVNKQVSPNSDTEVCLTLTDKGKIAYNKHMEYHAAANDIFFDMLREMPKEVEIQLEYLLEKFDKSLDDRLK